MDHTQRMVMGSMFGGLPVPMEYLVAIPGRHRRAVMHDWTPRWGDAVSSLLNSLEDTDGFWWDSEDWWWFLMMTQYYWGDGGTSIKQLGHWWPLIFHNSRISQTCNSAVSIRVHPMCSPSQVTYWYSSPNPYIKLPVYNWQIPLFT